MSEHNSCEGDSACKRQAISSVSLIPSVALQSGAVWSGLQNNNNNEYYFSLADGSWNNNNKNNSYNVVPVESEELENLIFGAEEDCWSNKHDSWDAAKYHYHYGIRVWKFIEMIKRGEYQPWKSICFVILYPRPREVFAAHYQDRIAHHIVAPYIIAVATAAHKANGNMSFGNRKGMSAYHACLRVQAMMSKHPNGYIASWDVKGFFMSLDKQKVWEVFCYFEKKYRPTGFTEWQRELFMGMIHTMIMHDPTVNCERHSPIEMWELFIAPEKTIFGHGDKGIPIGNYYAQLLANLFLAYVCELLYGRDVTEFVDDFADAEDTIAEIHETERILASALTELKLRIHTTKKYVQPVRHGIPWCGHMIFTNRMYIDNRPVHNCLWKIEHRFADVTLENAIKLQQTINSYTGAMCHLQEWNTQQRIMNAVFDAGYSKYVYFVEKPNHVICELKKEHTAVNRSKADIEELDNILFNTKYRISMIIMPIKKDAKHFERKAGRFIYRYGYQPIEGSETSVQACIEELRIRLKEPAIRKKVTDYCASVGIPNEYNPADYGYGDTAE